MVGTPQPPHFASTSAAERMTSWFCPSPVKAAMPASRQAGTRISLYSRSVYLSP